jgi:CubicO group peptidase (beta-lactamase class C family)
MIVRHGYIVAEAYASLITPETTHQSYSYAKSVTGALIGALLQDGLLENIDMPVVSLFPDDTIANLDERKEAITVRDLLTMAPGLEANDLEIMMTGLQAPATEDLMYVSEDWLQFALDQPMATGPGTQWNYNNMFTHILSGIITELTGMSASEYANEKLFAPLGIVDPPWGATANGITYGFSDLHVSPRDMAKIGYLYLNHGQWDGQQIIPSDYADASLVRQIRTPFPDSSYGYQWWHFDSINASFALGHGGQYIMLFPDKDMLLIATGGLTEIFRFIMQAAPMAASAAALTTADEPLVENPDGAAQLEAALLAVHTETAQPVPPLPAMAQRISGVPQMLFAPNLLQINKFIERYEGYRGTSLGVNAVKFDFDGSDQATLMLIFADQKTEVLPVGLDNVYRVSEGRQGTVGSKGAWITDTTFRLYLRVIGPSFLYRIDFNFMPGALDVYAYETISGGGITILGLSAQ